MKKLISISISILFCSISICHAADSTTVIPSSDTLSIPDAVVTGTRVRTDIRHLPMTLSVVNRGAIVTSMQPSLLPLLSEQVPGLFVTSRGTMGYGVSGGSAGAISIRGLSGAGGRLLVLIDGHPQYMGLMGHPIADAYQSIMAEKVEVLRGPASVLYGSNAMGGVVNIVTRSMDHDGVLTGVRVGYGSYNTLQTEATNTIRHGKFSSVISGSYDRSDGHRSNMDFEQYGGNVKLGYRLNSHWNATADASITHFNASNPGAVNNPLEDSDQRITRGMASAKVENQYDRTSGALSFFYNWGSHWVNDGYHPGEEPLNYRFNSRDQMLGVSLYQSMQLFKGNRITAGLDYFHFGGRTWNQSLAGERLTYLEKAQDEYAGYIDFRQSFGSWLTLDAGLRIDNNSHVGTEWVPQVGLSFHLPRHIELKAMVSKGFRYPTLKELYLFAPANPDLLPERIWNYELSVYQHLLGGRLRYGVNVFYISGENTITTVPIDGRPKNVNTGKIENAGVELQGAFRVTSCWSVDANYSYLYMKYPVVAAPEHKLYGGVSFNYGRWNASTGVQYVSGLYTSLATASSDAITEDFVLWNLRVSFAATKWLSLWVRGDNLLGQSYEINQGFPMPGANVMGGVEFSF